MDPVAVGRAEVLRNEIPGTAPNNTTRTTVSCARRTITWRAIIVGFITVLDPLPDVTVHLMETPRIGSEFVDRHRPLAIGALATATVQRFHEKWPRIEISLASGNTFQLLEKMAEGGLDLTLTTEHEAAHGDAFLMRDQLVWIGAPGGRAHLNPTIPVALSGENCAFRPPIVRVMSEVSQDWRLAYAVQDQTAMLAMVEADLAVSVSLTSVVPSSLRVIDSGLPPLPQSNINLRRPAHCESPITAELAAHVQRHFRRISQRRVPLKPVALAG